MHKFLASCSFVRVSSRWNIHLRSTKAYCLCVATALPVFHAQKKYVKTTTTLPLSQAHIKLEANELLFHMFYSGKMDGIVQGVIGYLFSICFILMIVEIKTCKAVTQLHHITHFKTQATFKICKQKVEKIAIGFHLGCVLQ